MKVENSGFEKLVNTTRNLVEKGARVFGGQKTEKNTGVVYGGDLSIGTPVFAEEKNTAADIQEEAGRTNVRQTKNTLALLSNTMTEEDYKQFLEDGGNINDTEIDTIVTVVEKIQISLATYCEDYQGYTGDISREVLEKMAGNSQLAYSIANTLKEQDLPVTEENVTSVLEAVSMAEGLEPVQESTALYLLQNKMEPTIENMYIGQHSTGNQGLGEYGQEYFTRDAGNYYSKIGAGRDYAGMTEKMEEIIVNAGLEVNEETVEAARWMMEHNIPLTEENLQLADRISEVSFPQETKKLIESIVNTIAGGEKATKAPLTTDDNYVRRSQNVLEVLENATVEDVKATVANQEALTIENLEKEQQSQEKAGSNLRDADARVVSRYRQLEELRLQMTIEASVRMMRKGISVETTELASLVEQLKTLEQESYAKMLESRKVEETQDNINMLSAIAIRSEALPYLPAAVLGNLLHENVVPTMEELYDRGMVMRQDFRRAEETYEALGTAPRSDMGDSIQKAFANNDALLTELGLEVTEENNRAVRILGYNGMEITQESVAAVKTLDASVQYLMKHLNPSVALEMVREKINPLNMPVEEVNQVIERIREDLNFTRDDHYSEFLWKMEQNHAISEEEREALVGIYRLLYQIEKSDGAAIGSVMERGTELTLQNLLGSIRSRKGQGMDISVNDAFGAAEEVKEAPNSITSQINQAFSEGEFSENSYTAEEAARNGVYQKYLAGQILDQIAPEKLSQLSADQNIWDMDLEQLLEYMRKLPEDAGLKDAYIKEQLKELASYRQIESRVIEELNHFDLPVTFRNLSAMESILQNQGAVFKQLLNLEGEKENDIDLEEDMEGFVEASDEAESLQGRYETIERKVKALCERRMEQENLTSIDVRAMKTLYGQCQIFSQMSRREQYYVPLKTEEGFTGVRLTILHQREDLGKVQVSMETETLGKVKAEFYVNQERISGYVATDSPEGYERVRSGDTRLLEQLSSIQENVQIDYLQESSLAGFAPEESQGAKVFVRELYSVAKSFLENLQSLL